MSISKEKGQYFQAKWEEMEYKFANIETKKEIERLQNIIKEAREYIDNNTYKIEWGDLEQDNEDLNINDDLSDEDFIEGLLEILDKEK